MRSNLITLITLILAALVGADPLWADEPAEPPPSSDTKDTAPPPDVLSSQKDNLASRPLRAGEMARDGNRWDRLR